MSNSRKRLRYEDDNFSPKEEDQDSPPKKKPYEIRLSPGKHVCGKKVMRTYKNGLATDTAYDISIVQDDWRGKRISDLTTEMKEMWQDVINTVTQDGAIPTDLIRIHISHRDLRKGDIKIPLQRVGDITPEAIMNQIAMVLQSYDTLKADDILEIVVGLIKFPRGEGIE